MTDSTQQKQKTLASDAPVKSPGGAEPPRTQVLPAGRISTELRREDAKTFWNRVNTLAKQLSGMTTADFVALPKSAKDKLRVEVLAHYGIEYTPRSKQWLYVMTHPSFEGCCKIGITSSVRRRLVQYQVGCPNRAYRLEFAHEFLNIEEASRKVYAQLSGRRLQGEWFEVSPSEAVELMTQLREELES